MRTVVIMGAGGRDFHDFNTVFRDDPDTRVVAFTATQIPGIAGRTYPAALAGSYYPDGIPIRPEEELPAIIREHHVDEVVLAYSDLSHEEVMHKASAVLAAGADFRLLGPRATMLPSAKPVVAVSAVRTGAGKSQTSRRVGRLLLDAGLRVALVRHPMPYGDLERMRVQRFATLADIDASNPTIEEREEYEEPVRQGMVMYAGVDYRAILYRAEHEAEVIVWDGGNNDFPFFAPDLHITVADPLRAGHELRYHPGETNLRMADVVVINKVDSAEPAAVAALAANVAAVNPRGHRHPSRIPGDAGAGTVPGRLAGAGRGGRPDPDPRRYAVRGRHGRRPRGRGGQLGRPPAACGRLDRRGLPGLSAHRAGPPGDGLRAAPDPGAGGHHRRRRLRRGRGRHPDQPPPAARHQPSSPPGPLRAA
jgi:predicted GTPase